MIRPRISFDWSYRGFRTCIAEEWGIHPGLPVGPATRIHFATELEAGWLAVWEAEWRCGFGVTFPHEVFRCVWVWLVDGGWRGIRCAAVEPWISRAAQLDEADDAGHSWTLRPREKLVTETRLIGFQTDGPIAGFMENGTPIAAVIDGGA